jgi:hypothetical protein
VVEIPGGEERAGVLVFVLSVHVCALPKANPKVGYIVHQDGIRHDLVLDLQRSLSKVLSAKSATKTLLLGYLVHANVSSTPLYLLYRVYVSLY